MDSILIVNMLSNTDTETHEFSPILTYCRIRVGQFLQVSLRHYYREASRCTNALAKLGGSLLESFILYHLCPDFIPLLLDDLRGVAFSRKTVINPC